MLSFNQEDLDKFRTEIAKQSELNRAAQRTNDEAVILARWKELMEWEETSPYSFKNFKLEKKANELAQELYGKPFSEMSLKGS